MSDTEVLTAQLEASTLREAANVTTLISAGGVIEFDTDTLATPPALLETYQARAEHLQQFASNHARRLQKSTEELCQSLTELPDEQSIAYARMDDSLLGSYIIWFIPESHQPVGCQYVIGKSEVSDDVWEDIWHQ